MKAAVALVVGACALTSQTSVAVPPVLAGHRGIVNIAVYSADSVFGQAAGCDQAVVVVRWPCEDDVCTLPDNAPVRMRPPDAIVVTRTGRRNYIMPDARAQVVHAGFAHFRADELPFRQTTGYGCLPLAALEAGREIIAYWKYGRYYLLSVGEVDAEVAAQLNRQ